MKDRTKYQLVAIPIIMGLLLSGIIGPLLLYDFAAKGTTTMAQGVVFFIIVSSIGSSIGIVFWWRKYRTLEIEPDFMDRYYIQGRKPNQCTICKKHPVSKKYHLSAEHNLKNAETMEYFVDCGCEKCQQFGSFGN